MSLLPSKRQRTTAYAASTATLVLEQQLESLQAELDHERSLRSFYQRRAQRAQERLEKQVELALQQDKSSRAELKELETTSHELQANLRRARDKAIAHTQELQMQLEEVAENYDDDDNEDDYDDSDDESSHWCSECHVLQGELNVQTQENESLRAEIQQLRDQIPQPMTVVETGEDVLIPPEVMKELQGYDRLDWKISGGSTWHAANIQSWSGKIPLFRSRPGNPPRERLFVYQQPFTSLTSRQKLAAKIALGIQTQDTWEEAMPRRLYSESDAIVLVHQPVPWEKLSLTQQQEALQHLEIGPTLWNGRLAPLHDDLWMLDDMTTLSPSEFDPFLSVLSKMSSTSHSSGDLVRLLLSLERVFTPSQGRLIVETIRGTAWWRNMDLEREMGNQRLNPHFLVASFLSDPNRFVNLPSLQLLPYWDDDCSGCVWGNACDDRSGRLSYAMALQRKHERQLALCRCVGPILTGTVSTPLPKLPKEVAKRILFSWIGAETTVDPHEVSWITAYESFSVTSVL